MNAALTVDEKIKLSHLEAAVEEGRQHFHKSIVALKTIYDGQLWREFTSFKDYWQNKWAAKWGFDWNYAYKLVEAAQVIQNLSGCTTVQLQNESQTRPLKPLLPEQQVEAVNAAAAIAPDNKPTAAHVARAADAVKTKSQPFEPGKVVTVLDESSPHYGQQVEVIQSEGVIVQAKTQAGETIPFLSNELTNKPAQVQTEAKPKFDRTEAAEAALDVERLRVEALEGKLVEAVKLLKKYAPAEAQDVGTFINAVGKLL